MIKHYQIKNLKPLLVALLLAFWGSTSLFAQEPTPGVIGGVFTINEYGDKVVFSQGNLQYIGSAETPYWKFADNQWDYLGTTTGQDSDSPNVDRDLFGWGTSGYNHGANCYQPWSTSSTSSDYYAYGSSSYNLFDQTGRADWGYNAILNGGNQENYGWRTLTSDEWDYLFNTRTTESGIRYAKVKMNDINGIILLPDDWSERYCSFNNTNSSNVKFSSNIIDVTLWNTLERFGAIFLPAAGIRYMISISYDNSDDISSHGYYWSSQSHGTHNARDLNFSNIALDSRGTDGRNMGYSVRLVNSSQNCYFCINAAPNSAAIGWTSGNGTFPAHAECTLTATPVEGYAFANWMEKGFVVSTDASYSFLALRERNLVANFVPDGIINFADPNVKALCVTQWDINGDGELSYAEAANVTDLGTAFKNNTTITSLNELQYFVFLTKIDTETFYGCTSLTQVSIPEQVTAISNRAFYECSSLSQISIPEQVVSIGEEAFYGCTSLTQVNIPEQVTAISNRVFYECSSLSQISIPEQVVSIGEETFYGCTSLTQVTIPEQVTTIGGKAFWNCPSLQTVNFNAVNCGTMQTTYYNNIYSTFSSDANGSDPAITRVNIGNEVTRIPDYAFKNASGIYPGLSVRASVAEIGDHAFENCSSIATLAFASNSLLERIGDFAFSGCSGLNRALNLPNAVTTVGQYAFFGCSEIPSLTIGENVESIGAYAFWNCPALATVNFNATNCLNMMVSGHKIHFQYSWTSGYYLQNLSVFNTGNPTNEEGVTPIVTLNIGSNVTNIPPYAFKNSSNMTCSIDLPDAVTTVGEYAFEGCSSSPSLILGENMETIGNNAFSECSGLTGELEIPVSVISVGNNAFNGCSSLTSISYTGDIASWCAIAFGNEHSNPLQYAHNFYVDDVLVTELVIPNTVTTVGNYAFHGGNSITSVEIPSTVTSIGAGAFRDCSGLTAVYYLGDIASWCGISFGDEYSNPLRYVHELTIDGSAMTELIIPSTVTSIGQYAFQGCSSLTGDLVIPNGVTSIGQYAFQDCSGFDGSLFIGSGIQTINPYTFAGCSGFAGSLILGVQVNSIGDYAFQNCNGFTLLISENPNPVTATSSSFTGMNYSIPVYVPDAMVSNYQNATGWNVFTNYIAQCTFWDNLDNANWSDEMNWLSLELPTENDVVCIAYNCDIDIDVNVLHAYVLNLNDVLTVKSGHALHTDYGMGILQASQLIIEDGAQLYNTLPGVQGTVQKQITGYNTGEDGWFTIATPIYDGTTVSDLTTGSYDLFAYDELTAYWKNQKGTSNDITQLNPAQGYLYANQADKTLIMAGQLNASDATFSVPVTRQNGILPGFNLLGNPYTNNIDVTSVSFNETPFTTYYKAVGGSQLVAYTDADNDAIQPAEGFFVQVSADGTVQFNTPTPQEKGNYVQLVLIQDDQMIDRAYLRMNEGATLNKAFVEGHPSLLYFQQAGQPCAVASQGAQAYHLGFEAVEEGTYTIESALLNAECGYLHLIDRLTGADIDLLSHPQYTFEAATSDDPNRFVLLLADGANPEEGPLSLRSRSGIPLLPPHNSSEDHPAYLEGVFYVDATANPAEGGTVEGAGSYAIGVTVTLTAVANEGYTFVNWTETVEGETAEVTTDAVYSFTVTGERTLVANFSLNSYAIAAMADPSEGGTITGTGTYNHFENCTLTAEPNYGYAFVNWTEDGEVVSTDAAYSFTVTGDRSLTANFVYTLVEQTSLFSQGWNWWSSSIELTNTNGLEQLENSLGDAGIIIKSRTNGYVEAYDNEGVTEWYGNLDDIENEQMYMVRTNAEVNATVVGDAADPTDHPITINQGWNWIGFPCRQNTSVETALAGFNPENDDVIKSRTGFSTYYSENGTSMWFGQLNVLEPGVGYMYRSFSADAKTLVFQAGREEASVENVTDANNYYKSDGDDFAYNMTVTAVVELEGVELRSDLYEVAAFVGDECRGSVKLMYVAPIDRYVAFLTVLGEPGEAIGFRLTDGEGTSLSDEEMTFDSNAAIGTLSHPVTLRFGTLGVDDDLSRAVSVYPNPSDGLFRVEGQGIRDVAVFNVYGQCMLSQAVNGDELEIDLRNLACGVYTLRVVTDRGVVSRTLVKQ